MYRTDFWTVWEKARVEWSERIALKHVYYQVWNRSPVQVGCMRQMLRAGALGWPSLSSNNNMQIHSVQQLLPTSFCPVLWYCYSILLYYKLTKSCYFCLSESYFLIFRNRKNCIYFLFKSFSNFIIFSGRTKSNSSMVFFQPIENSFFTSCSRSASSIFYMKMSVFGILLWKIF